MTDDGCVVLWLTFCFNVFGLSLSWDLFMSRGLVFFSYTGGPRLFPFIYP